MSKENFKIQDLPRTIKELKAVFSEIKSKIDFINQNYKQIDEGNLFEELYNAHKDIYGEKDEQGNIIVIGKLKELENAYNEIIVDGDEESSKSLRTQIKLFLDEIKKDQEIIQNVKKDFLGYTDEDTNEEIQGLQKDMTKFFEDQQSKYKEFYEKIDKELNAGVTSVKLAKTFSDKVRWYSIESGLMFALFLVILVVSVYQGYTSINMNNFTDIREIGIYRLYRLPIVSGVIWLAIFISNRRAEAKKLAEAYTHKEIMARSFVGYKESIEELSTDDKTLLQTHMNNLLTAIGKDSSDFLIEKGENHPFVDFLSNLYKKGKFPTSLDNLLGSYVATFKLRKEDEK